jgi:hypothetical protein
MIEHMFMPLSKQPDDGFGVVGQAFQDAADHLRTGGAESGARRMHGHLPVNYLYRHAIELYLKSIIVTAHRRLRLQSGEGRYDPIPQIPDGKTSRPIYSVHGLRLLFNEMKRIFTSHRDAIGRIARTDWSKIPDELSGWIEAIDDADPASTAFRYPVSRSPEMDAKKSSFKAVDVSESSSRMHADGPKQFALLMVDGNDNVVESFALDNNPLPELRDALLKAVEMLSGAQFGVIMELGVLASGKMS